MASSASQPFSPVHHGTRVVPPRPQPPVMPPHLAEQLLVATLKRQHSLNSQDSKFTMKKVTGSTELRKSSSASTSSISSVTSIKTTSGQPTSLSDQRLPPNLRPLPPTPGTSSFRPVSNSNTLPVPIRKISSTKTGVLQFPWYHNVDRRRGEELVFNGEDGTFLIRPSSQSQNPYTLTIWFGKRVYNIGVRHRADGKFALGTEKQNEQSFRSVEEMVSYYQSEQLVLYSGGERTGQTALKSSPKKE